MSPMRRVLLCVVLLASGLAAQASLERATQIERPALRGRLSAIPMELGEWVGRDEAVDPDIVARSQATEYLSRVYESRTHPGRRLSLWINYSREGLNLRHSPEICLPSGGWAKVESLCQVMSIGYGANKPLTMTRLGYMQGELVQGVGFWYYIFGEGRLERYVRGLPITSRSSHGRTTRGSGMTVEVFWPAASDPDGKALEEFATLLLPALEPIMPEKRAEYFIP
jgi:hypothetical protein